MHISFHACDYNTTWHCSTAFLISLYGAPLPQRASYLALHSSLFGPDGAVNYDYIVSNSINYLLIGSRCIPNGTHTNHCWANWPMLQNIPNKLSQYLVINFSWWLDIWWLISELYPRYDTSNQVISVNPDINDLCDLPEFDK